MVFFDHLLILIEKMIYCNIRGDIVRTIGITEINDSVVFKNIYGIFQTWDRIKKYSYLTTPRPNHGFIYLDTDVVITTPMGDEKKYTRGTILYLPKGAFYQASFPFGENIHTLLVNFEMYLDTGEDVAFTNNITKLVSDASAKYTDEFHKIIYSFKTIENNHLIIKSAFYSLCAEICSHLERREKNSSESCISPALIYIENNINESLSVAELAKLCALSEASFRRNFKSALGITPLQYIRRLKIYKAKELLKMPDATLSYVSDALGFYDLSYFCKVFELVTGVSPNEFRKKYL
jgi:AraC-like DNA-binding protein